MKSISSLDFTKIGTTQQALSLWSNMWRKMYQNLTFIVNGHISFGDGTHADNIDGVWVNTASPGGTTNFTVTHNLGRIPVGYILVKSDNSTIIYDGTTPPTKTQITWKSTNAANIRMFVFLLLMSLFVTKCVAQPAPKYVQTPVPHWSCPKSFALSGLNQIPTCVKSDQKGVDSSKEEYIFWYQKAKVDKNGKPVLDLPKEIKNPSCSPSKTRKARGDFVELDCNGVVKR